MRVLGVLPPRPWRLSPRAVDGVGALVLVAVTLAQDASGHRSVAAAALDAVPAATVAVRRMWPDVAAVLSLAVPGLLHLLGGQASAVAPVAVALNYYLLGRRTLERGWTVLDAVLLLAPIAGIAADPQTPSPGDPLIVDVLSVWVFFLLAPFLAGYAVAARTKLIGELRVSTEGLAGEQLTRIRQAAAAERMRIARELHDVIAHSMTVMVMQTAAARRVLGADRDAAMTAMNVVEACGRDALLDLRRMVGVLHRDDLKLLGTAAPGVAQLDKLAQRALVSGLAVQVTVEGRSRGLSPALDLVVFRVVQEAITNAIKHAGPGQARVRVAFSERSLELEIVDTGTGAPAGAAPVRGGQGLVGMRERLALYGGSLEAGPVRAGGFCVRAQLPLTASVLG